GYDLNAREMLVHSGLNKAQREPFHVFMRTWSRADYWARVMLPPGQLPATARPLTFLRPASDLEQTGRLQSAEAAYRSAVEQWPDQPTARFGLGNTLWAGDTRPAALEQFQNLVNDFPDFQPGRHNLATGLQLSGWQSPTPPPSSAARLTGSNRGGLGSTGKPGDQLMFLRQQAAHAAA